MAAATIPLPSVEVLTEGIGRLVAERQALRAEGADRGALEENRLAIARLQRELSDALIARFLSAAA